MARKLKSKFSGKKAGTLKLKLLALQESESKKKKSSDDKKPGNGPTKGQTDSQTTGLSNGPNTNKKRSTDKNLVFIPFEEDDKVLLIGEGDFTFAKSIVQEGMVPLKNVIATSYDSLPELQRKYKDNIDEVLQFLHSNGVPTLHEIDGQLLVKSLNLSEKKPLKVRHTLNDLDINVIMFNFPHTGSGIKDVDRNIKRHQELLVGFFQSCNQFFTLLRNTSQNLNLYIEKKPKVILSLFEGEPYDSWGVKKIAKNFNYKVQRSGNFNWSVFKSYHHRRTNGTLKDTSTPVLQRRARIYVFEPFVEAELPKKKRLDGDDSDDE